MSADFEDDEGDLGELDEPEEGAGNWVATIIVEFYFDLTGKVIDTAEFECRFDHSPSDDEVEACVDQRIGPLYTRIVNYPRLHGTRGGTVLWRIVGTYISRE